MSPFLGFLRLLLLTQSSPIGPFGARPLGPIDTTSVTSVTFDSCFRTHPHPCSVEAVKTRRRTALTTGAAVAAAALGLSACTARMDMTIAPSDTYDATLVMRDTTGTVLTGDTDCQDYADPSLVGAPAGTAVSSTPVGSVDDADGVGCEVTVTGVRILDAEEAKESGTAPLVARDGDLYVVTLSAVAAGLDTAPNGSAGADSTAAGTDSAAPSAPAPPSASSGSLSSIVDAHLSITFPGAVVDAGGKRLRAHRHLGGSRRPRQRRERLGLRDAERRGERLEPLQAVGRRRRRGHRARCGHRGRSARHAPTPVGPAAGIARLRGRSAIRLESDVAGGGPT